MDDVVAVFVICLIFVMGMTWFVSRKPALEREARKLRSDNARLSKIVADVTTEAGKSADVLPQMQVILDIIHDSDKAALPGSRY